ncbi:MAG: alginate lyase family protein [Phycisphaerae bacterium]|nr:alginate lyase family protein [Phycisphaerae bacterium]
MNRLLYHYYTVSAIGWDNLPRRLWHLARQKLGVIRRRLPGGEIGAEAFRREFIPGYQAAETARHWRERARRFFFSPESSTSDEAAIAALGEEADWSRRVTHVVDELRQGRVLSFGRQFLEIGRPPQFNRDPLHGLDWPTGRHWTTYGQFTPGMRDLKCVWEASRFSWAFYVARAYLRDRREDDAALFWEWFEAWDRQNPYGLTAQWVCGQEGTFRMFAWLFAAIATLDSGSATSERLHRMTELVWYTARHIDRNIDYARGQKNNHALSEAAGLLTAGLLFPEFRQAARWREKGIRILNCDLMRQIYPDGSYVQHSMNYHRVMLDDVLWAARLGEIHGRPLDPQTLARVEQALNWLLEMIDPDTGRVPNYGSNDGAQVLPLSACDYTDFRPVAQAAHYLLRRTRCFRPGAWDEKMYRLFGAEAFSAPVMAHVRSRAFAAPDGGYYTLAGKRSWGMIRCHTYRDRPSQSDMLHLDLWINGVNVLRDAGSYHYYCATPWQDYFYSSAAHNTVEIEGQSQMIKGPRFTWLRWIRSRLLRFEASGDGRVGYFEGEHYGYTRLPNPVVHRRGVLRIDDHYLIIDDVLGAGANPIALRWHLADLGWKPSGSATFEASLESGTLRLRVLASQGFEAELLSGRESPRPEGWESVYYAEKLPQTVVRVSGCGTRVRLASWIDSADNEITVDDFSIDGPGSPIQIRRRIDASLAAAIEQCTGGRIRGTGGSG